MHSTTMHIKPHTLVRELPFPVSWVNVAGIGVVLDVRPLKSLLNEKVPEATHQGFWLVSEEVNFVHKDVKPCSFIPALAISLH
jgi:hypothetical protein